MIPISNINGHYFLWSAEHVDAIRRLHSVQATQTGTLPQVPQQNRFKGLPAELMPAEVDVLVRTKGVAYLVDDITAHESRIGWSDKLARRARRFERLPTLTSKPRHQSNERQTSTVQPIKALPDLVPVNIDPTADGDGDGDPDSSSAPTDSITPSFTDPALFLPHSRSETSEYQFTAPVPSVTTSPSLTADAAALVNHIHQAGYTIGPGMQYGAEYVAYPGPPEATHSQLLLVPIGGHTAFTMRDILGITRLGNSVQKLCTIGGLVDVHTHESPSSRSGQSSRIDDKKLAVFTIEWAGF